MGWQPGRRVLGVRDQENHVRPQAGYRRGAFLLEHVGAQEGKLFGVANKVECNLAKRGVNVGTMLCPQCDQEEEDVEHLFFRCGFVKEVWGWFGK